MHHTNQYPLQEIPFPAQGIATQSRYRAGRPEFPRAVDIEDGAADRMEDHDAAWVDEEDMDLEVDDDDGRTSAAPTTQKSRGRSRRFPSGRPSLSKRADSLTFTFPGSRTDAIKFIRDGRAMLEMMERLLEIQPGMIRHETQAHAPVAGSRKTHHAKNCKHSDSSARRSYRARREVHTEKDGSADHADNDQPDDDISDGRMGHERDLLDFDLSFSGSEHGSDS